MQCIYKLSLYVITKMKPQLNYMLRYGDGGVSARAQLSVSPNEHRFYRCAILRCTELTTDVIWYIGRVVNGNITRSIRKVTSSKLLKNKQQ
jgi:hypothetical protein